MGQQEGGGGHLRRGGEEKAAVVIKNNSEWGEEKKWRIKIQDGGAEGRTVQGGGDGGSRLEIPPPSPARKSPPGSLAETPRGGGEHRPPPSPPLPPPFPSSLRGALVPPACRARRAAAPATALRSFFFFLLSVAHDLLAPSGETPPAPALPAAEGHRGQALPYARRCGRIHNSRRNTTRPPSPIPCRSLPSPPPAAAASRRPAQRQPASPPASAPRPRRRDSASRSSHDRSQAGAAPRRMDFAERKQVPGHPAALGRPVRVCAERSPGHLTPWKDPSARSCPLNARDSPPRGCTRLLCIFMELATVISEF
ncbi:uncharacterized protein FN964_004955 [Alca torda]